MNSQKTRSPLGSTTPLRVAGQSLDEELEKLLDDHALGPYMLAAFFVVLAALEWWRYSMNVKPSPWLFTITAIGFVVFAALKIYRTRQRARLLKQGRDGERLVAQYLEWFRSAGYFVFHDIPTINANIDHLLVGPKGVFTIETKTHSKPERGPCKLTVQNGEIFANGLKLTRNPAIQAKAQTGWAKNFLGESRFQAPVWPVVLFPGWFVEPFDTRAEGIWVLEPKALSSFLERTEDQLSREQVQAIASAFTSYVRSKSSMR